MPGSSFFHFVNSQAFTESIGGEADLNVAMKVVWKALDKKFLQVCGKDVAHFKVLKMGKGLNIDSQEDLEAFRWRFQPHYELVLQAHLPHTSL